MSLQKVTFKRLDENLEPISGQEVEALFNPTEYTLNKGVQYAEVAIPGLDAPLQQFVRGQTETLSLELFFDSTEDGMGEQSSVKPVTEYTDRFYQLVKIDPGRRTPPILLFQWGERGFAGSNLSGSWAERRREGFTCVVESVNQRFTLFSPLGVPLRATLTVRLREYQTLAQQVAAIEEIYVFGQGDSLENIAAELTGDAGNWREIAEANDISDPTAIEPGTVLQIPAG